MKKAFLVLILILIAFNLSFAKLRVVTTTQDLASIASFIGKDQIELNYIAKVYQDPHFVDPKPSYLLKLRRADLLVAVGLELEVGWLPALVKDSRNSKIISGKGYLDASEAIEVIEKPVGQVSRAEGDVHPFGNPHYWTDPENGKAIAGNIAAKLSAISPENAAFFQQRYEDFSKRLAAAVEGWKKRLAPYAGAKVVTYHRSWPNFAER